VSAACGHRTAASRDRCARACNSKSISAILCRETHVKRLRKRGFSMVDVCASGEVGIGMAHTVDWWWSTVMARSPR